MSFYPKHDECHVILFCCTILLGHNFKNPYFLGITLKTHIFGYNFKH